MSKGAGDNTTLKQNLQSKSRNVVRRREEEEEECVHREGGREKKNGEEEMSEGKRKERGKKRERELLFFSKTCLFGKIRIKKKSKFYWKFSIANIFLQFFII